jgi:homeobox protein cut-like
MDAFAVSENILAEQEKPDINGNQSTNTEDSNKFQRAISSWRGTAYAETLFY